MFHHVENSQDIAAKLFKELSWSPDVVSLVSGDVLMLWQARLHAACMTDIAQVVETKLVGAWIGVVPGVEIPW